MCVFGGRDEEGSKEARKGGREEAREEARGGEERCVPIAMAMSEKQLKMPGFTDRSRFPSFSSFHHQDRQTETETETNRQRERQSENRT